MTFERTMYRNITVGAPVYSMDNEQLGTVKEIRGDAFKVDAPMKPDFWLPTSCLTSAGAGTAERLTVSATKEHIGDLKVDEPRR